MSSNISFDNVGFIIDGVSTCRGRENVHLDSIM